MRVTRSLFTKLAICTLFPSAVLFAQDGPFTTATVAIQPPGIPGIPGVPGIPGINVQESFSTFKFVGAEATLDGGVVTGAPYSAEAVTETSRVLSDGNQISTSSTSQFYRDSAGRTRREMTLKMIGPFASAGDPPKMIVINDPVAKVSYTLDPLTHTAHQIPTMVTMGRSMAGHVSVAGQAVIGGQPDLAMGGVNVKVFSMHDANAGSAPPAASESLGTTVVEGVTAEGTRTTRTIPEGQIGNARPITIVNETWYSPDLQTTVMTKMTNPLEADVTFRLTNIQRVDPPASLFEVPADYTVVSGGNRGVVYQTKPR